jgi:hypothetical protein
MFRATPTPTFDEETTRNRGSLEANRSAISADPSVDASSTMTTSKSEKVWVRSDSKQVWKYGSTL